jgi:fused signal recognition particle receptor
VSEKKSIKTSEATPRAEPPGFFDRIQRGLSRSSAKLGTGLRGLYAKRKLDPATLSELEEVLIAADLGPLAASRIVARLAEHRFEHSADKQDIRQALSLAIAAELAPVVKPFDPGDRRPHVALIVGVNGTGKTTTIGKLAWLYRRQGKKVLMAAGDTFRAAAIEQLKIWGERADAPVVARSPGADPAALAFDALMRARAEGYDLLLIDTAGRLQNKADLMAELAKIARVLQKIDESAPHSVLLVLDASTGQNALSQIEVFRELVAVTGLIMTKLDGTARGGILVAAAGKFRLPVHFIGVGEGLDDLVPLEAGAFANALCGAEQRD